MCEECGCDHKHEENKSDSGVESKLDSKLIQLDKSLNDINNNRYIETLKEELENMKNVTLQY